MLYTKKRHNFGLIKLALLLSISCFAFHSHALADNEKALTAEEYRDLGFAEQKKGNLPQALTYYLKATELGLDNPVVLNDIGIIYESINYTSKAEMYYLKAVQADENYLPALMNLAYLYQGEGKNELAFQHFRKRYEKGDPKDPWTQKAKEELLKIHPEFIEWIVSHEAQALDKELVMRAHEEFTRRTNMANEHYLRGQEYAKDGMNTRALLEYDEALKFTPKNPKVLQAKRDLELQQIKEDFTRQSDQALKMLESGNTQSAKQEIRNMLATIPNE